MRRHAPAGTPPLRPQAARPERTWRLLQLLQLLLRRRLRLLLLRRRRRRLGRLLHYRPHLRVDRGR